MPSRKPTHTHGAFVVVFGLFICLLLCNSHSCLWFRADFSDPRWADVNAIASALKLYLRKLPNPLVPFEIYHDLLNALGLLQTAL